MSKASEVNMQFDREKLKALVLRAMERSDPSQLGAVKLNKIAYFADMLWFADFGAPITGATYRKQAHGPICEQLRAVLRDLDRAGEIEIQEVDYFGYTKRQFVPHVASQSERFSAEEVLLIDEVIDFVCKGHSAKTISEFSHNRAWDVVEFGEVIPYPSVFLIFPSQASLEALEWAEGEVKTIEEARSLEGAVGDVDYASFRGRLSSPTTPDF